MGSNSTFKSIYTAKETIKKKPDNPQDGENICKWSNWQKINPWNIQTTHTAQY